MLGTFYVVGIVSWGPATTCGTNGNYGAYSRVSTYTSWIRQHVPAWSSSVPSNPTTGGGGGGSGNGGPQTNPPPCPLAPAGISIIGRLPLETEPPLENDDPCGPPELEDDGEIACPNNFQFVAVTTHSLWQEAKVTSVYVRLGYIGQAGYSFINVQIPALYLGLPYHNQNGGIMYTNMEARQITAAAFNFAEVDLRMHFRNFPHLTANQLETYWISRIDLYIKAATWGAGKAGTTGSANPINPVQGVPYDPIPGNGGPC